jgi:hypothetical protein
MDMTARVEDRPRNASITCALALDEVERFRTANSQL